MHQGENVVVVDLLPSGHDDDLAHAASDLAELVRFFGVGEGEADVDSAARGSSVWPRRRYAELI